MFGIELTIPSIAIVLIQLFTGVFQFFRFTKKPAEKHNLNFLLLTILFLIYNLATGFSRNTSGFLTHSASILLCSYYFYFIFGQLLPNGMKYSKPLLIICGILVSTMLILFVSQDLRLYSGMGLRGFYPVIMVLYFSFGAILSVFVKWSNNQSRIRLIFSGSTLVLYVVIALTTRIFDRENLMISFSVNIFFFIGIHDYLIKTYFTSKKGLLLFEKVRFVEQDIDPRESLIEYGLTPTEIEIANLMLDGLDYQEIATKLGIQYGSVTKHASNICAKTQCPGRRHKFMVKFSKH